MKITIWSYATDDPGAACPIVRLFLSEQDLQEAFVADVVADERDVHPEGANIARLRKLQKEGAPIDVRYGVAREIYDALLSEEDMDFPYYHEDIHLLDAPEPATGSHPPEETHKLIVLSTSHISREDDECLRERDTTAENVGAYVDDVAYGYLVTLGEVDMSQADRVTVKSLLPVVEYAVAQGAKFIRLDPEGPVVPSLPTFEW